MTEYHPGSTLKQHRLKDLFLPTSFVLLLYALISLIMLILLNVTSMIQIFSVQPVTTQDIVPLTERFQDFQDRLSTPIVMIFWLFIGAITYTGIWLAENVFFIAKTQVAESQYVSRDPNAKQRYWEPVIRSNIFLVFIVLLWVCFIALYLRVLLPAFSLLFRSGLYSAPVTERLIDITAAILGNMVAIYLIFLGSRLISHSWRANRP